MTNEAAQQLLKQIRATTVNELLTMMAAVGILAEMVAKQTNKLLDTDKEPSYEQVEFIMHRAFKVAHDLVSEYPAEEVIRRLEAIALAKRKANKAGKPVFISIENREPDDTV